MFNLVSVNTVMNLTTNALFPSKEGIFPLFLYDGYATYTAQLCPRNTVTSGRSQSPILYLVPKVKTRGQYFHFPLSHQDIILFNTLTPELNPSAQRCLTRFFTGDFAS
jgi:hypothetical protein